MAGPTQGTVPKKTIDNLAIAKVKVAIAVQVATVVAEQRQVALKRIIQKKINNYYIESGKVYLNVQSGIPSSTFDKSHLILGIGKTGVQGLISNDFSFVSGSTVDVKYDTGVADAALVAPSAAAVFSVNPSPSSARTRLGENEWNTLLNKNKSRLITRKITYQDMPNWDNELNPNRVRAPFGAITYNAAPPTSANLNDGYSKDDVEWYWILKEYYEHCVTELKKKQKGLVAAQNAFDTAKGVVGNTTTTTTSDGNGKGGKTNPPAASNGSMSGIGDDTKPVIHNLPAVKEMYFTAHNLENFNVNKGNLPSQVAAAENLWKDSAPYKGMIQSYIVPAALDANGKWWSPNNAGAGLGGVEDRKRINTRRYGFQFQYNPSTVQMAYAGAPQVDIGLQTSGTDKVALIGSSVTSSTVTFSVIINRMHDFKYLNPLISGTTATAISDNFVANRGRVNANFIPDLFNQIYSHTGNHEAVTLNEGTSAEVTSINQELKQIKELGTMYDIEYLLRTLLGYQLKSSLRNKFTSDIGYLGAYPVELHLGKNLRYLGIIDGFSVSHTIFNQNMVPVFSNVTITFSRLPDFAKRFNEAVRSDVKNVPVEETK